MYDIACDGMEAIAMQPRVVLSITDRSMKVLYNQVTCVCLIACVNSYRCPRCVPPFGKPVRSRESSNSGTGLQVKSDNNATQRTWARLFSKSGCSFCVSHYTIYTIGKLPLILYQLGEVIFKECTWVLCFSLMIHTFGDHLTPHSRVCSVVMFLSCAEVV